MVLLTLCRIGLFHGKDREWESRVVWKHKCTGWGKSGQDGRDTKTTGGAFAHKINFSQPPTAPNRQKEGLCLCCVFTFHRTLLHFPVFLLLYLFRLGPGLGDEDGRKFRAMSWGLGASWETSRTRWGIFLSAKLSMEAAESDYRV